VLARGSDVVAGVVVQSKGPNWVGVAGRWVSSRLFVGLWEIHDCSGRAPVGGGTIAELVMSIPSPTQRQIWVFDRTGVIDTTAYCHNTRGQIRQLRRLGNVICLPVTDPHLKIFVPPPAPRPTC